MNSKNNSNGKSYHHGTIMVSCDLEKMTKDLSALAGQEKAKLTDGFLASQLRLPNSSQDYAKRLEFWKKFPFLEKWAIVQKVEDRLGLTEKSNEQLFPTC